MAEGFGGSVMLGDINDFIAPSLACVNPLFAEPKKKEEKVDDTRAGDTKGVAKISLNSGIFAGVGDVGVMEPDLIKKDAKQTAKVSLNDCLACSGCVTSAETVLITEQSASEFYEVMKSGKYKLVVVTVDPSARSSLAVHFKTSPANAMTKLRAWLKAQGVHRVFDTSIGGDISLLEAREEFVAKYKAARREGAPARKSYPWKRPPATVALSSTRIVHPAEDSVESAAEAVSEAMAAIDKKKEEEGLSMGEIDVALVEAAEPPSLLPVLASACPGWICYAEKTSAEALAYISTTKSPQAIMGTFVKKLMAQREEIKPEEVYHVTIMPCFDKKLEASRKDFFDDAIGSREVDCVLTPNELLDMINDPASPDWHSVEEGETSLAPDEVALSNVSPDGSNLVGSVTINGGSGGYVEHIFRYAAKELYDVSLSPDTPLAYKVGRNPDMKTLVLEVDGEVKLKFGVAYGFRNIQTILRKLKRKKCDFDYVEIMACPAGCPNGGGQVKPASTVNEAGDVVKPPAGRARELAKEVEARLHEVSEVRPPEANSEVSAVYRHWVGEGAAPYDADSRRWFHTRYHAVPKLKNPLTIKW